MTTLAGDVVLAGVRANKFQRVYETVAQMLAATDTIADGELVQAERYFYEGAGSATDHDVTNAGGSRLYCLASPYVTPDQFGAPGQGNNETSFVNAAIASRKPVFLNRYYDVTNVHFPANVDGITIVGAGSVTSGLKGIDVNSEAVFQTFQPGSSADAENHFISNFGIIGDGKRAFALCQAITSNVESIHLASASGQSPNAFRGVDGFVIEVSFSNTLRGLRSSGVLTGTDMKVNATVLNTIVDLFYTNNAIVDYHLDIDQWRQEIAEQVASGHGTITFNTCTFQGARGYGIKIASTYSAHFHNAYFENCVGAALILDADFAEFTACDLNATNASHGVWVDQAKGAITYAVNFDSCFLQKNMVVGSARAVTIRGSTGAGALLSNLRKTNTTFRLQDAAAMTGSGALKVSTFGEYLEASGTGGVIGLKCSDSANYTRISVNNAGIISAEAPFAITDIDRAPYKPVAWVDGTGTPAWTNGVAISPVVCGAAGGAGTLVFSIAGDKKVAGVLPTGVTINASTGSISGTPTQTGTFRFKVRATDTNGSFDDSRTIMATVT